MSKNQLHRIPIVDRDHLFYNKKLFGGTHISNEAIQASWNVGAASSYGAMLNCIDAWLEDFRPDGKSITVPTLVIHGDEVRSFRSRHPVRG